MIGKCASCKHHACYTKDKNRTAVTTEEVTVANTNEEKRIMDAAAHVEATFYSNITRLQETAEFAKAMGYKRLGMALNHFSRGKTPLQYCNFKYSWSS